MMWVQISIIVLAAFFLLSGLRLLNRKPLCLRLANVYLIPLLPIVIIFMSDQVMNGFRQFGDWVIMLAGTLVIFGVWIQSNFNSFGIFNITSDVLNEAFRDSLKTNQVNYEQVFAKMILPEKQEHINITMHHSTDFAKLQYVGNDMDLWHKITDGIQERLKNQRVHGFPKQGLIFLLIGIVLAKQAFLLGH